MEEVIKIQYWSKSEAFLLPLTGLSKTQKYPVKSYLFWEKYSIENYNLIIVVEHDNYDEDYERYFHRMILGILSKNGLMEVFEVEGKTILIMDMSTWAFDIDMFMAGKYSKMSTEAVKKIKEYHLFYENGFGRMDLHISMALFPNKKEETLNNKTPIEYVCQSDTYGFDLTEMKKLGELASIYDKKEETLADIECQNSILSQ